MQLLHQKNLKKTLKNPKPQINAKNGKVCIF